MDPDPNDQLLDPGLAELRDLEAKGAASDYRARIALRFIYAFIVYNLLCYFFLPSRSLFLIPNAELGVTRFGAWVGGLGEGDAMGVEWLEDIDDGVDGYGYGAGVRGFGDVDVDAFDHGVESREEMGGMVEPTSMITLKALADMETEMLVRYQQAVRDALALSAGVAGREGYPHGEYHTLGREERGERGSLDGAVAVGWGLDKTRRWGVDEKKAGMGSYTPRAARRYTPSSEPKIGASRVAAVTWRATLLGGLKTVFKWLVFLVFGLGTSAAILAAAAWEAGHESRAINRRKKIEAERLVKEKEEEEFRKTGGWTPIPPPPGPKGLKTRSYEYLRSSTYEPLSKIVTFLQGPITGILRTLFWVGGHLCRLGVLGCIGWLIYRFLLFWTKEDYERKNRVDWWLGFIIQATAAYSVIIIPIVFIFGIRLLVGLGPDDRVVEICELCAQPLSSEQVVHTDQRKLCNEHRRQEEQRIAHELKLRGEEEMQKRKSQQALTLPSGEQFRPVPWATLRRRPLGLDLLHSHDSDAERLLGSWHGSFKPPLRRQQNLGFSSIYDRRPDGGWKHSFTDTCTPKPRKDRFL